jgi:glycosyltransferase involved in cell wall biosynthesis
LALTRRLKILISAYACSPEKGSEPAVGWGFVSELARHHDLWVITEEEKFHTDITRYLDENPEIGRSVRFFFICKKRNRFLRKLWPPSYYLYYRRWHEDSYKLAKELHQHVDFDIAHQLTMIGFREPGYLWNLGIPFVWGPVGGMGLFPWRFLKTVGCYGALYYFGYNLFNLAHMKILKRPKLASQVAGDGLLTANMENHEGALRFWNASSYILTPVGPPYIVDNINMRGNTEPFRIVWTGLHIPRKALNLGLEALSRVPLDVDWELHILGAGPRSAVWQRLANRLGISGRCCFHGWQPRDKALEIMKSTHVMLFTSLREGTPSVVVEALALGLPIICLDHSGMADMCDDKCGIKIPVTNPGNVIVAIASAIELLARDEDQRRELARGALRRARMFSWEEKAKTLDQIYRALVTRHESTKKGSALAEG